MIFTSSAHVTAIINGCLGELRVSGKPEAGNVAEVVTCVPGKPEALGLIADPT